MDGKDRMEDINFIDGLPVELNSLRTSELLNGISIANFPIPIFNSDTEQYVDGLGEDNTLDYQMTNMEGAPERELPNSTVPNTPAATCTHPCTEDFEGDFGFDICREALGVGSSNSWAYSDSLQQVFIKMSNVLMIQFKTSKKLGDHKKFFIRALLVYQNNDFVNQAVNRCSIHSMEDDPEQNSHKITGQCKCDLYNQAGHVLRCHTDGAIYQYDASSERHSVLVSVPGAPLAGSNFLRAVHYFFTCKTSCPRGMQRRAVQIIFTLEDESYQVYGRKVLPIKICSCPKRDKDRQERDAVVNEISDRKPTKRPMMAVVEDVKPTKTERDQALFSMQIRQATWESLVHILKETVHKQGQALTVSKHAASDARKALNTMEASLNAMEQRHNELQEIVQQICQNRPL